MKNTLRLTVAALAFSGAAQALTIDYSDSFDFVPNGTPTLELEKFNSSLGTLNSVYLEIEYTKTGGKVQADNDSDSVGTLTIEQRVDGSLKNISISNGLLDGSFETIGGDLDAVSTITGVTVQPTTGDDTENFNATGDVDFYEYLPGDVPVSDDGYVNDLFKGGYAGNAGETFTVDFEAHQSDSITGASGIQKAVVVPSISGTLTVTYDYTPIPEPGMLGFALLGGAALIRRRRG